MTAEVPNVTKNGRYSINLTAQALGIHRNTLRRIPVSLLPKHHRLNGRPYYEGREIILYWYRNRLD